MPPIFGAPTRSCSGGSTGAMRRMRGCSANCRPAPTICRKRSNTRPRPATCSRSSAGPASIFNRCSTRSPLPPRCFAAAIPEGSRCAKARSFAMCRTTPSTTSIGRPCASEAIVPGRDSVAARVPLEGRVVHIAATPAEPDYVQPETAASGRRTILGVPLLRDGAVVGTIMMARSRVEPYTERQIELVRTFADQAVIAMENARLLGELRQRTDDLQESLEYQTATSDVLKVISGSSFDIQPVFDTIVATAARLCRSDTATILMRDGEVYRFVSNYAVGEKQWAILRQRPLVPSRQSVAGRVALEGRVVQVADILADPDFALPEAVRTETRTILGVPLLREGAVVGTINLARRRVEPYTERQIELVRTFADQAVIAIENARLLKELQARTDELTRSVAELQALEEVLRAVNSSLELDTVLATIISRAAQLSQADEGTIYEFDETEEVFVPKSAFGMSAERVEALRERKIRIGETHIGRSAMLRAPVHVEDVQQDPTLDRDGQLRGIHAVALAARGQGRRRAGDPPAHSRRLRADHPDPIADLRRAGRARDRERAAVSGTGPARRGSAPRAHRRRGGTGRSAPRPGPADPGREDGLARSIDRRHRPRDQEPAQFRQQLRRPVRRIARRAEGDRRTGDRPTGRGHTRRCQRDRRDADGNLEKIAEHGRRADGIVKSMLEHSRGESGERREVDLNTLVEEALNLAYHGARAQDQKFNITLERDFGAAIAPIELVPQDITRVCLNLFGNGFYAATKRQKEGGDSKFKPTLKVSTRDLGDAVEVRIRDNGTGISPEIKDKLFQPFFTPKPTGEGTGLGLSISYDIVTQQHGGAITVDSR